QMVQDTRFNKIFFGPWGMGKASIKARDMRNTFGKPRGYKADSSPWTTADWTALQINAQIKKYPSLALEGITLTHASLRELPTNQPRYSKPAQNAVENPFDNFQYSALPLGTPLFITHISQDQQWYFVETPMAGGWLPVENVGTVDSSFEQRYQNGRYAALIKDDVSIISDRGLPLGRVHVGAIFPVLRASDTELTVMVPVRGPGNTASISVARLTDAEAVIKPLPLLPKLIAVIGNQMLGQPYGWGGMNGERDCSSTTRDLFAPFGLWLPRNSASQAKAWRYHSLEGLSPESKEQAIGSDAIPFASLLWMRGHVGLYVGKYKNTPAMFHNIWGVRVDDNGQNDGRHVIGRCVITSLQPGKELPNAQDDATLLQRIRGFSTVPEATR
ncbi:MAG: SH3 domain-containing protein, partial [Desulfovibrionaceae bacterium]